MTVAPFDTLKYAKQLKLAGVPEEQANAQTDALKEALQAGLQDLVTKSDIEKLDAKIDSLRLTTKSDIEKLDAKIDTVKTELNGKMDSVGARLDGKIDNLGARLDGKIDSLAARLDGKIDSLAARLDGRIDAVRAELTLIKWLLGVIATAIVAFVLRSILFH